jgi:hypothetical protein
MSDLMLLGVLQMPVEMVMADPLSTLQYIQRGHEAAERIKADAARLAALESERDEMIKALAECRDAMPIPEHGSPIEGHCLSAMGDPLEVPGYIGECYKTLKSERDALLAAAGKEAVAWMTPSDWRTEPLATCDKSVASAWRADNRQVTPLYTAPTAALEKGDGRDAERYRFLAASAFKHLLPTAETLDTEIAKEPK